MRTRAAVLRQMQLPPPYATSRPLSIEEVELDPPGPGEVLLKIEAVGLCHSDLSTVNGDRPRPLPMVLGHEAAATVLEAGPGVDDLAPGDRAVCVFVPSCGRCLPCVEGRPALCEPAAAANGAGTLLGGGRRLRDGATGAPIHHHLGVSAFAEHAVVSRRSLVRLEAGLSHEEAALFGCAAVTGVGAVVNTARVPPGATVAVVGLGGVGLAALLGAVLSGARRVVAVDLVAAKLALARQLGASDAFDAADSGAAEAIRAATGGGVDYAFEMAGSARAMELAYKITRRGGTTVTASLPHPTHAFAVPHTHMVFEERTLKGSYVGGCVPPRDIPRLVELYRQGRLPLDRLMSERVKLADINRALDRLAAGAVVRQIVTMD